MSDAQDLTDVHPKPENATVTEGKARQPTPRQDLPQGLEATPHPLMDKEGWQTTTFQNQQVQNPIANGHEHRPGVRERSRAGIDQGDNGLVSAHAPSIGIPDAGHDEACSMHDSEIMKHQNCPQTAELPVDATVHNPTGYRDLNYRSTNTAHPAQAMGTYVAQGQSDSQIRLASGCVPSASLLLQEQERATSTAFCPSAQSTADGICPARATQNGPDQSFVRRPFLEIQRPRSTDKRSHTLPPPTAPILPSNPLALRQLLTAVSNQGGTEMDGQRPAVVSTNAPPLMSPQPYAHSMLRTWPQPGAHANTAMANYIPPVSPPNHIVPIASGFSTQSQQSDAMPMQPAYQSYGGSKIHSMVEDDMQNRYSTAAHPGVQSAAWNIGAPLVNASSADYSYKHPPSQMLQQPQHRQLAPTAAPAMVQHNHQVANEAPSGYHAAARPRVPSTMWEPDVPMMTTPTDCYSYGSASGPPQQLPPQMPQQPMYHLLAPTAELANMRPPAHQGASEVTPGYQVVSPTGPDASSWVPGVPLVASPYGDYGYHRAAHGPLLHQRSHVPLLHQLPTNQALAPAGCSVSMDANHQVVAPVAPAPAPQNERFSSHNSAFTWCSQPACEQPLPAMYNQGEYIVSPTSNTYCASAPPAQAMPCITAGPCGVLGRRGRSPIQEPPCTRPRLAWTPGC